MLTSRLDLDMLRTVRLNRDVFKSLRNDRLGLKIANKQSDSEPSPDRVLKVKTSAGPGATSRSTPLITMSRAELSDSAGAVGAAEDTAERDPRCRNPRFLRFDFPWATTQFSHTPQACSWRCHFLEGQTQVHQGRLPRQT